MLPRRLGPPLALGASLLAHVGVWAALAKPTPSAAPLPSPLFVELMTESARVAPPAPIEEPLAQRVGVAPAPAPQPKGARAEAPAVRAVAATRPAPTSDPPAAAPAAVTSDSPLPTFTLAVVAAPTPGASQALSSAAGAGAPGAAADDDATYGAEAVDVPARPLSQTMPRYPPAAQAAGFEGNVVLEIVVSKTGVVDAVRIRDRAGHGFDEEASSFARSMRFSPAMKRGHPVAVRMFWPVRFQLE